MDSSAFSSLYKGLWAILAAVVLLSVGAGYLLGKYVPKFTVKVEKVEESK